MRSTRAEPAEAELVRRARAGSREAYGALVERYAGSLHRYLLVRTGNAADAEELAQEAFLRGWSRLATYRPRWRFSTWLFAIARSLAASRRRAPRAPEAGLDPDLLPSERDPVGELGTREEGARLWAVAAAHLPPEQRDALWLRYAEDLAPAEIARVLGRRPTTVRVLLHRARRRLARHLAPEALDEPAPLPLDLPVAGGGP